MRAGVRDRARRADGLSLCGSENASSRRFGRDLGDVMNRSPRKQPCARNHRAASRTAAAIVPALCFIAAGRSAAEVMNRAGARFSRPTAGLCHPAGRTAACLTCQIRSRALDGTQSWGCACVWRQTWRADSGLSHPACHRAIDSHRRTTGAVPSTAGPITLGWSARIRSPLPRPASRGIDHLALQPVALQSRSHPGDSALPNTPWEFSLLNPPNSPKSPNSPAWR